MADLEKLTLALASEGKVGFAVKVVPKSSRNQIAGWLDDHTLKIKVAAAPEKGRANAELCAFLARMFVVPKSNVSVESGHTSARKRIKVVR